MRTSLGEGVKVPCPYCGSCDHVVRKGVRRNKKGPKQIFLCKTCGKRFSERKTILRLPDDVAEVYLTKAGSVEHFAKEFGLPKTTFYRRLRDEVKRCPDWNQLLKTEKRPEKSGSALGIDTTGLKIRSVRYVYIHVADVTLHVPIAYEICAKKDVASIEPVLRQLRDLGYNPQIIVTDLARELLASIENIWPNAIIQGCVFHVRRRLNKLMPTKNMVKKVGRERVMLWRKVKNIINCVCMSKDEQTRQQYLKQLNSLNLDEKSKCFVDDFLKNIKYYHVLNELKSFDPNIVYNNLCECHIGMIRRLERKMLCFKSIEAARDFIKYFWYVKRRISGSAQKEEQGTEKKKQDEVSANNIPLPFFDDSADLAELSKASDISKDDLAKTAIKKGRIVVGDYAFSKNRLNEIKETILKMGETSVGAVMREIGYDEPTTLGILKKCGIKFSYNSFDPWANKIYAWGHG